MPAPIVLKTSDAPGPIVLVSSAAMDATFFSTGVKLASGSQNERCSAVPADPRPLLSVTVRRRRKTSTSADVVPDRPTLIGRPLEKNPSVPVIASLAIALGVEASTDEPLTTYGWSATPTPPPPAIKSSRTRRLCWRGAIHFFHGSSWRPPRYGMSQSPLELSTRTIVPSSITSLDSLPFFLPPPTTRANNTSPHVDASGSVNAGGGVAP